MSQHIDTEINSKEEFFTDKMHKQIFIFPDNAVSGKHKPKIANVVIFNSKQLYKPGKASRFR